MSAKSIAQDAHRFVTTRSAVITVLAIVDTV